MDKTPLNRAILCLIPEFCCINQQNLCINSRLVSNDRINNIDFTLRFGRYPAVVANDMVEKKKEILTNIVNGYLLKDILAFERVKNSKQSCLLEEIRSAGLLIYWNKILLYFHSVHTPKT